MHQVRFLEPAAALKAYVRFYAQREGCLGDETLIHPVTARAAPILEFMFGDPCEVRRARHPGTETSPRAVIVGVQTNRRLHLVIRGKPKSFVIFFQPAGLHRLFSLPMDELRDRDYEARAVLGSCVSLLERRLADCASFAERARMADSFLLLRSMETPARDGVSEAARRILLNRVPNRVSDLARAAGMSVRQFERKFVHQVGLPPKWYARIARFELALESKANSPEKSWTEVAYDSGYCDQIHMVHDFKEFTGQAPTETLNQLETLFREQLTTVQSGSAPKSASSTPRLIL